MGILLPFLVVVSGAASRHRVQRIAQIGAVLKSQRTIAPVFWRSRACPCPTRTPLQHARGAPGGAAPRPGPGAAAGGSLRRVPYRPPPHRRRVARAGAGDDSRPRDRWRVVGLGDDIGDAAGMVPGQRISVPWLGRIRASCGFCASHRENPCDAARFRGRRRCCPEFRLPATLDCLKLQSSHGGCHDRP